MESGGYSGRILRVNLTDRLYKAEALNRDLAEQFIGGRGIGAKILWDELEPGIDPLSPANKLIVMTGPLTGAPVPTASKYAVITKSPLTGFYGIAMGGASGAAFGPELKFAGYDGIIVEGKAEKPVYLWIKDGNLEFRDAGYMWGMTTDETQHFVKKELENSKPKMICIGPAGENLVRFACIVSERRTASRCGVGAVMGSKNLKAIAVNGTKKVGIKDEDGLRDVVKDAVGKMKMNAHIQDMSKYSTAVIVTLTQETGGLPTRNFSSGVFESAENLKGETLERNLVVKRQTCWGCPVGCRRISVIKSGLYAGTTIEGPDYETIAMLGSNCGMDSLETVSAANERCDNFGLDSLSTGGVIAFAMECYEKGLITKKDTDGLELSFGNGKSMIEAIRRITYREGFGDLLANGVKAAAEKIGKESMDFAIHAKGLEIPAYDPRAAVGNGLNFATAACGGHANRGITYGAEIKSGSARFQTAGKAKLVKDEQDLRVSYDSAILCILSKGALTLEHVAKMLNFVAGTGFTSSDLRLVGERVWNLERAFIIREGASRKDDTLPHRFLKEKGNGVVIDLEPMLNEYYKLRGWLDGIPTLEKLDSLGLRNVADELKLAGH